MAKHTLKILRCEHRKIFIVCLAIFQHYEIKGYEWMLDKNGKKHSNENGKNQKNLLSNSLKNDHY